MNLSPGPVTTQSSIIMMGNHETLLHNGLRLGVSALAMIIQLKLKFPNSPSHISHLRSDPLKSKTFRSKYVQTKQRKITGSQSYFDSAPASQIEFK